MSGSRRKFLKLGALATLFAAAFFGSGVASLKFSQFLFQVQLGPSLRSGFRLRAPASLTPAKRLKIIG